MPTITTKDGTGIYYKDWGTGAVAVFSHGWPLSSDSWEAQMLHLAANGCRCIAHDRRGHGRSSQPWDGNEMDTYADDLAALLDALDVTKATLIGFSTGGGEVARYIGRHGTKRVARAAERAAGAQPDVVEVVDDDPVGLEQTGLRIAEILLGAVGADDRLDQPQVRPRHAREQVVLDLEVEPAHRDLHEETTADVARHHHLAAEEVDLHVPGHDRHALVARREGPTQAQAEDRHLHEEEGDGQAPGQEQRQRDDVRHQPRGDQGNLQAPMRGRPVRDDVAQSGLVEVEPLEGEQREEQPPLTAQEPGSGCRVPPRGDLPREGKRARPDVRVTSFLVGVGVVEVVLALPPAQAETGEDRGEDPRRPVVPSSRREHLPVGGVVTEETELGHHESERDREQQLEPGVAQGHDRDPDRHERRDGDGDPSPVPGVTSLEESAAANLCRELGVRQGGWRGAHQRRGGGSRQGWHRVR